METIVIISLVAFWLAVTILAGQVMESLIRAVKNRNRSSAAVEAAEKNIRILRKERSRELRKTA